MKCTVSLDLPDSMEGVEFEVPPVGVIANGSSVEVELTKEQVEALKDASGITVKSEKITEKSTGKEVNG